MRALILLLCLGFFSSSLAGSYSLVLFYKSTCIHCQREAPIVRNFSETHHLPLIAITLNGQVLPDLSDSLEDQGEAQLYGVTAVPALFLLDNTSHQAYSVSVGEISRPELQQRLTQLMARIESRGTS